MQCGEWLRVQSGCVHWNLFLWKGRPHERKRQKRSWMGHLVRQIPYLDDVSFPLFRSSSPPQRVLTIGLVRQINLIKPLLTIKPGTERQNCLCDLILTLTLSKREIYDKTGNFCFRSQTNDISKASNRNPCMMSIYPFVFSGWAENLNRLPRQKGTILKGNKLPKANKRQQSESLVSLLMKW